MAVDLRFWRRRRPEIGPFGYQCMKCHDRYDCATLADAVEAGRAHICRIFDSPRGGVFRVDDTVKLDAEMAAKIREALSRHG